MLHARYRLSATSTRTSGWGKVSADSDQLCSAAALQAGDNPSGPPISRLTSRPSSFQRSSSAANCGVSQGLPGISRAQCGFYRQRLTSALASFSRDAFDISILAAFSGRNFNQLEGHIFRKTTQVLAKTGLYPVRHFRSHGDKLQLHALTPEFFQFIQTTALFLHDMDNHIAQIHDNPVGAVFTFYAER